MAEQAKKAEEKAEQAKKAEGTTEKVYTFKSTNKFLSCVALGVQFINGTASTTNREVARALVKIDGVTLVED
jgi:hypothetical protein